MKHDDVLRLRVHPESYSFQSALELMKNEGALMVLEPAVFREKQDPRLFFYADTSAFTKWMNEKESRLNLKKPVPAATNPRGFCFEVERYVTRLENQEFYWVDFDYSIENAFVPFKPGSLLSGDLQHRRFKRVEWPLKFPAAINLVAWKRDRMLKVEIIEGQNFVERVVDKFGGDDQEFSIDQEEKRLKFLNRSSDSMPKSMFETSYTGAGGGGIGLKLNSDLPETHMPIGPGLSYPVGYNILSDIINTKKLTTPELQIEIGQNPNVVYSDYISSVLRICFQIGDPEKWSDEFVSWFIQNLDAKLALHLIHHSPPGPSSQKETIKQAFSDMLMTYENNRLSNFSFFENENNLIARWRKLGDLEKYLRERGVLKKPVIIDFGLPEKEAEPPVKQEESNLPPMFKLFKLKIEMETIQEVLDHVTNNPDKKHYIGINSGGGSTHATFFLVSALNRMNTKNNIALVVVEYVLSAAFDLFDQFKGERYATIASVAMIHPAKVGIDISSTGEDYFQEGRGIRASLKQHWDYEQESYLHRFTEEEKALFLKSDEVYFSFNRLKELWPNLQTW